MRYRLPLLFVLIFSWTARADSWTDDDFDLGSGFVNVEVGQLRLLGSGRSRLKDSVVINLNVGISLTKEFKAENDFEPLKLGPKIGMGFGRNKITNTQEVFYDALLKMRYTFFPERSYVRAFVDAGPGMLTYGSKAFELEGGGGLETYFGSGSFGVNAQYKQIVGSDFLSRAFEIVGSLGYRF